MYNDSKSVIAFKIDIRIVYQRNGIAYDLVNAEAARHEGNSKIVQNEGKLIREGKDMINHFIENHCDSIFPFMMQIVGPSISAAYTLLLPGST